MSSPGSIRKRMRMTYFQHHIHCQKDKEERRWKDKSYELEKKYDNLLENSACFIVWGFFIIVLIELLSSKEQKTKIRKFECLLKNGKPKD
ncbi:hypothetical protein C1646_760986 [Rhizophagus diaphanus]|nr:hypothetical protein C1646_760986 [Rhizophagus diaphanus] [Rhizophagus sp. MUCL 43196]